MACTIACDKGHITAHKNILCDHSKYLQDILSKHPTAEHPIIILTELNIMDIKILVNYMYTGELVISNDCSPTSLLRAAQLLQIDLLTANDGDEPDEGDEGVEGLEVDEGNGGDAIDDGQDRDELDEDDNDNDHQHDDDDDDDNNLNTITQQVQFNDIPPVEDEDYDMIGDDIIINNHIKTPKSLSNLQKHLSSPLDLPDLQDSISKQTNLDHKNKIRCHLCNIGLSDVKCLYRHVLTRHLPEKWGYKCEFCDREFSRDDHLMRHYTTKHKNMEFNREKIRETRRLNREMAKNFHDQISTI